MNQKSKITTSYYFAFISLGLVLAALGPTLPGLAAQTDSGIDEISILFVARSLGFLLGALLVGRLYDRFSGHRLMSLTITFIAIIFALVPFIPELWLLTAVMLLLGLFEPGIDVGGNTLIVWLHRDKVAPYMNGLHFFFGIGAFLSPIIVAWAIRVSDGIQWAFWIIALLVLLPALAVMRFPSPSALPQEERNPKGQNNTILIFLIALFFFLYVGAEVSYGGWIFTFTIEKGLSSEEAAALLTSVFWGSLTVGRLIGIPLATKFRNRSIILADMVGCLCSVGLILLWPNSLTAVWLGTIGLGVAMASIFPTVLALAERHLHVSGQTTSYFFVGASVGAMTIPWLIGQRFEQSGPLITMTLIFACLLLATAVFGMLIWQINQEEETIIPEEMS